MKLAESKLEVKPPKILLYGNYGSGKTLFSLTCGSKTEYMEIDDGGGRSALTFQDNLRSERIQAEYMPITDDRTTSANKFQKFRTRLFEIVNLCATKSYSHKILVIDSFTTLVESAFREVQRSGNKLESQIPKDKIFVNMTIPEWGIGVGALEQCLYMIRGLPICVILIAHEMTINDTDGTPQTKILAKSQKLPDLLPAFFDEVWYARCTAFNNVTQYKLLTKPDGSKMARSRSNVESPYDQSKGLKPILEGCGYTI